MPTPHFSSPYNFGAIPKQLSDYKSSKIVILPVPYDATTSYKSGTRDGPGAIISASRSMELFDEETNVNISDIGLCTLDELDVVVDPEKMADRVYQTCQHLLNDSKTIVMLGGEHSLSFGYARALIEKYPKMSVLHIDAHSDLAFDNGGTKYDHGCVARRISELCPIVQVGIRSISREDIDYAKQKGIRIFYASDITHDKGNNWIAKVTSQLTDDVYVTIDVDALDISIMPSVGTPEPGGIQWYQLLELLKQTCANKNIIGFDVVELCPIPGNVAPDFAAAKIVKKLIAYAFAKKSNNKFK